MRSAIVYSRLAALKTPITRSPDCLSAHPADPEETLLRSLSDFVMDRQTQTHAWSSKPEVWATERDASLPSVDPRVAPAVFLVVGVIYRQHKCEMLTGESVLGSTACGPQ